MRTRVYVWLLIQGLLLTQGSCSAKTGPDSKKVILTFSVTMPYHMPEAMEKMAQIAHSEGVPINWQAAFENAIKVKDRLREYHRRYGDELIAMGYDQDYEEWSEHFPWATLNIAGGRIPTPGELEHRQEAGIIGSWGYCYQQAGVDGITHWGAPWGLFYVSPTNPLIPAWDRGSMVGIPWTLRDLHKGYHLQQPINFSMDPIEMVRSGTLCSGENITYFRNVLDELIENTAWNERVYCCLHEEANGPYIAEGKEKSDEGATPEQSASMYRMMGEWLRVAKNSGVSVMTLPQAVSDYQSIAKGTTLPSTILTSDKHHGSVIYYVPPLPQGARLWQLGPAGNFPNTLFHYDQECQMVFVHPDILPSYLLNYREQHSWEEGRPYPREQVLPTLLDWECQRNDNTRLYSYQVQFWRDMPFGVTEWSNFRGWEVDETNCLYAKIIDDRLLFLRMDLRNEFQAGRENRHRAIIGKQYWVKLRPVKK